MELEQSNKGQIPVIGALRGVAALAVALFHIINSPTGFETNEAVRRVVVNGAHGCSDILRDFRLGYSAFLDEEGICLGRLWEIHVEAIHSIGAYISFCNIPAVFFGYHFVPFS